MTPVNGHPEPATFHALNQSDQDILSGMVAMDGETTFSLKVGVKPQEVLRSLYIAARAAVMVEKKRDALLQVIGKILHWCKHNPETYQSAGYKSFDAFLKQHVTETLGMGRTTLRTALEIFEAFPALPPTTVAEVGVVKMKLLTKITSSQQPNHMEMVEKAKSMTYSELMQVAGDKANLPPGEILRTTVNIPCSRAQSAMWRNFVENPRVQAYCQTEDPGLILEYLIAEALGEWCASDESQS